jgi:NAD(P)-dependent dehydrogenase (short-subunit alcohol dehydrogenase family)
MSTNPKQVPRSAAITGAGSGLGRDIALGLAAKGYSVFGTAMTEAEVHDLKTASGGRVSLALCDITNEADVKAWAGSVSTALGEGRGLDVLISNAGILTPGPLELLPLAAIRREFDVNVFGALSVMTSFLPALRKARGRIVQVSTWTAHLPLPFNGPSGASKAAMEVLSTVYRAELKHVGVDVVIAAAGNMRTGGPAKTAAALSRVSDAMTPEQRALYGQTFGAFTAALNDMQGSGIDSASAARRVIELAEQMPAPSVAPVGPDAADILRIVREKSDAEQDALRLKLAGLSEGDSGSSRAENPNAASAVDFGGLMQANVARVFSERDPERRRAALKELYAEDAILYDPEAVAVGREEISKAVGKLLGSLPPDFVFTPVGQAAGHNGAARLFWRAGPPDGRVATTGTDVAHIEGGRIKRIYVFVDPTPR